MVRKESNMTAQTNFLKEHGTPLSIKDSQGLHNEREGSPDQNHQYGRRLQPEIDEIDVTQSINQSSYQREHQEELAELPSKLRRSNNKDSANYLKCQSSEATFLPKESRIQAYN